MQLNEQYSGACAFWELGVKGFIEHVCIILYMYSCIIRIGGFSVTLDLYTPNSESSQIL